MSERLQPAIPVRVASFEVKALTTGLSPHYSQSSVLRPKDPGCDCAPGSSVGTRCVGLSTLRVRARRESINARQDQPPVYGRLRVLVILSLRAAFSGAAVGDDRDQVGQLQIPAEFLLDANLLARSVRGSGTDQIFRMRPSSARSDKWDNLGGRPGQECDGSATLAGSVAGMARLCLNLPRLHRKAAALGRSAEVAEIVTKARTCGVTEDEVIDLALRLGIPDTTLRSIPALPGASGGSPPGEWFDCPNEEHRCTRMERLHPSGPVPECALHPQGPRELRRQILD